MGRARRDRQMLQKIASYGRLGRTEVWRGYNTGLRGALQPPRAGVGVSSDIGIPISEPATSARGNGSAMPHGMTKLTETSQIAPLTAPELLRYLGSSHTPNARPAPAR